MNTKETTLDEILWRAIFNMDRPNLPWKDQEDSVLKVKSQLKQLLLEKIIGEVESLPESGKVSIYSFMRNKLLNEQRKKLEKLFE